MLYVSNGIIIKKNKDILLVKRKKEDVDGGLWSLPGGKINKNENTNNGLAREINEELGIIINNAKFLKEEKSDNVIVSYFLININNKINISLNTNELDGFGFFNKEEIRDLGKLAFNQDKLLQLFLNNILQDYES